MTHSLVVAMAALSLLAPATSSAHGQRDFRLGDDNSSHLAPIQVAQGRGWGDGEDRGEGRGRRADPGPQVGRPPPESWNRGQYLPGPYRGGQVPDPGQLRLRRPPAGYDWVRVGRDVYLTQRSTGLVVEAIPGGY